MIHNLHLKDKPFNLIKNGTKTIELRLYDEKRSLIKVGDIINFENEITKEIISVRVVNLHKYASFKELYKHFNKESLGYKNDECACYHDMEQYYTQEQQDKYGVVGIEIILI